MGMFRWLIFSLFMLISAALAPAPAWAGDDAAQAQSDATVQLPRTNHEIRVWYNRQVSAIPALNQAWLAEGLSAEERARRAQDIRHDARIKARSYMADPKEVKLLQDRDQKKYGNPDGPSFDYLVAKNREKGLPGDAAYEEIITSSSRTDKEYNEKHGVRPPAQAP